MYGEGYEKKESHDYARDTEDPSDEWHIYELVWTPDFISFLLDGKVIRRVHGDDPAVKLSKRKPQNLLMNFWTPTFANWSDGLDSTDMPWQLQFDWVETYLYDPYTHGFRLHWHDDFNKLDYDRWNIQNNLTFEGSSTIFKASQVSVSK